MKKQNAAAKRSAPKANANESAKVAIRQLPTGARGLDEILGGSIPEFSFNIIAGTPGCGKTTLAHQLVFANATPQKPALYITILGEPAMKMLRYQQQFSFFDESKLGKAIRFSGAGVTILSTVEVEDSFTAMPLSHYAISFLTDDILRMRYAEIDGQIRMVMVVMKMRGGNHSKDFREYVITDKGVVIIGPRQTDYTGLTTGIPTRVGKREDPTAEPKATK